MADPIATRTPTPTSIGENLTSPATVEQADIATPGPVSKREEKAYQFEKMLNDQQKVTELEIKFQGDVFDPAQDIEINATLSQPSKTAEL